MSTERRCTPRVALTCSLLLAREEGRAVDVRTVDVGPGGARVRSARPLRVDEELRFDLDLADGGPHVGGRARVLRQHPYGEYALRFEQVSPTDAERLWAIASVDTA